MIATLALWVNISLILLLLIYGFCFVNIRPFLYLKNRLSGLEKIACPMPIGRARAHKTSEMRPIFRARTYCLVKIKKTLDLQFASRIAKTMKMLQWTPNTIMYTILPVIYRESLHIRLCQNCFIYSWMGNI